MQDYSSAGIVARAPIVRVLGPIELSCCARNSARLTPSGRAGEAAQRAQSRAEPNRALPGQVGRGPAGGPKPIGGRRMVTLGADLGASWPPIESSRSSFSSGRLGA